MNFWDIYVVTYTLIAFIYIIYRFMFALAYEKDNSGNYNGKVSVIIPYYNENPELLIKTIKSAHECNGEKEIIVIDDGSPSLDCYNEVLKLQKEFDFKLIRYEKNQGKRHAQYIGFSQAKGDVIATLDSDTLLHKDALINLMRPFSNPKVGATTGQLEVLNEKKNWLTKLQAARYWNAFNFERRSQSSLGVVLCCSGPISAYRKSIIDEIKEEYIGQSFRGKQCTYGDDRHLTTLILKKGYKVFFVEDAIGYTEVPTKLKHFWKQQVRWRKSWLRETYLVSKFMTKKSKALTFEVFISSFLPFFSFFSRIVFIASLVIRPWYIPYALLIMLFITLIHSTYLLVYKPKYFGWGILYGFFHEFIVYWVLPVALIQLNDVKWGTR